MNKAKRNFLDYETMIGSSQKTMQHYDFVISLFQEVIKKDDAASLNLEDIYTFARYMTSKGLSISTRANYLRHIKVFYHFLCNSSIITEKTLWREIKVPKQSKKIVKIYDEMEIKDIYEVCFAVPRWIYARNRCIISFMYDCGLRQEEVTKLRLQDVTGDVVIVHGKGRKDRIVPKGHKLQKDLDNWLFYRPAADNDYLFLTRTREPITKNTIKMFFQNISGRLGYPVSSHRLRHNFATNYLLDSYDKNGWFDVYSLMVLLGHEEISTTERYLHYCQQVVACRNAHSHLDKINFG